MSLSRHLRGIALLTLLLAVFAKMDAPTRWSTTLSSKVNLPHAIHFRALCVANLVTFRSKFRPTETHVLHRAGRLSETKFLCFWESIGTYSHRNLFPQEAVGAYGGIWRQRILFTKEPMGSYAPGNRPTVGKTVGLFLI